VARVCRKLDGIPLAIELAAARVTALAVDEIAARFEDSLDLLTSGDRTADRRHQTLRATLEWSHRLLSEKERKLFARLSAFSGGWTLEAAEAVGAGNGIVEDGVLDLLGRLVEKSLVVTESPPGAGGALRYRMLEPVRQYGRERLQESGEEEQIRERHARHYLALGEAAEIELLGPRPLACLERLEIEHGNLRAALGWYLEEGAGSKERAEMGLKLAAALGRFWDTYGPGEGRRWLERGLLARSGASSTPLRAKALGEAGFIAIFQGDPRAMSLLEEGLALSRELGDESELAVSISNLGHAVAHSGDHDRLATLREEAEALLREPLDRRARAHLLLFLGVAAMSEGDREQVAIRTGEALPLFRELGDIRHVAMSLGVAGVSALEQDDPGRAAELFEEDLRLLRELRDKTGIVYGLLGMAGVAALRGQPARASRLWGASEVLREVYGLPLTPMVRDHYDYEGYLAGARAGLSEAGFEAAWSEGRAMSPEQAIEYALGAEVPAPAEPGEETPDGEPLDALTPRQQEVALLATRGLTNRQVAAKLTLSEHTVATHVREILKKLGLRSRTELAAWLTDQDPHP
jgi:non-specific serine/threonine protein kinase